MRYRPVVAWSFYWGNQPVFKALADFISGVLIEFRFRGLGLKGLKRGKFFGFHINRPDWAMGKYMIHAWVWKLSITRNVWLEHDHREGWDYREDEKARYKGVSE